MKTGPLRRPVPRHRAALARGAVAAALGAAALVACTDAAPAPGPTPASGALPLEAGADPLGPGTYVAETFSRPFSFHVERETWVPRQVEEDIVTLIGPRTELQISTPALVFEKGDPLVPRPAPLPRDFVAWLRRRPDLGATRPRADSIGGVRARSLDVEVLELYEEAELLGCPLPCFPLAPAGGPEPLFLTHTHRVTVSGSDPPLVVVYGTGDPAGERAARTLLESLSFIEPVRSG